MGTGLAHERAAVDGLDLVGRLQGVPVGQEILGGERRGVSPMGVKGQQQRRPLLDDPHAGVLVPVDATLVPLGSVDSIMNGPVPTSGPSLRSPLRSTASLATMSE